jgi:hypothetical protein
MGSLTNTGISWPYPDRDDLLNTFLGIENPLCSTSVLDGFIYVDILVKAYNFIIMIVKSKLSFIKKAEMIRKQKEKMHEIDIIIFLKGFI